MNYFTLCVQFFKDGSEPKKSLYTYDNETEAVARFHSFLGGYMGGDNVHAIMSSVIDEKGAQLESQYWEEEVVPETVEEVVTDNTTSDTTEATE